MTKRLGNRSLTMAIAISALLLATACWAFSGTVTWRKEYYSGSARVAELGGGYGYTRSDERLTGVRMVMRDQAGRTISSGGGRWSETSKTWFCSIGDFRCVTYYAELTVSTRSGNVIYTSPLYTWGR